MVVVYFTPHAGDMIRVKFSWLGKVRSLIPKDVNITALTTTAAQPLRGAVYKTLRMENQGVVTVAADI